MTPATHRLITSIQSVLTPDLLSPEWRNRPGSTHPLAGHCYVAAEALYHLLGRDGYEVWFASYTDAHGPATHWWLVETASGERLDPTADQYAPDQPPYHLGKRGGFLTKEASKRARSVIARLFARSGLMGRTEGVN